MEEKCHYVSLSKYLYTGIIYYVAWLSKWIKIMYIGSSWLKIMYFGSSFSKKVYCIHHCIHIHWCIPMGLGYNDPWVESHMWPRQMWGQRSSRGQWPLVQVFYKKGHCIHIFWCIFMGLGHNDPWVDSHIRPQQMWDQRSSRGQWPLVQVFAKRSLYPQTLMYFQARLVVPEPPCLNTYVFIVFLKFVLLIFHCISDADFNILYKNVSNHWIPLIIKLYEAF